MTAQLELALAYAAEGIPVFPVSGRTKHPLTLHGKNDATLDAQQICAWSRRWPDALWSTSTGERSGVWVLDVDNGGQEACGQLLARLGFDDLADLSPVRTSTPGGGLHVYFRLEPGTTPRTRSSDIAPKIDTRGLGGSIILPGNVRPDGKAYLASTSYLAMASVAPLGLLWMATFGARERQEIKAHPELLEAMREKGPACWAGILVAWREAEATRIAARCGPCHDDDGMRRQALSDLALAASEYASIVDGRRAKLFSLACRCGRYVTHNVLSESELRNALLDAARSNGAIGKYGMPWARDTIARAVACCRSDRLPPLARAFRSQEARA